MEDRVREILEPGEELLWIGSPEKFDTMDKTNGGAIKLGTVIKAVVFGALTALYIMAVSKNGAGVKSGIIILFALLAAYSIGNPFLTVNKLQKKTGYAITDRRLIAVGSDVKGVEYSAVKSAVIKADEDGHSTLLCGNDGMKLKASKWRNAAVGPFTVDSDSGECSSLVFYALPEAQKVEELLKQYLPL